MSTLIIQYRASVFCPCGWRGVDITAKATRVSPGFAIVDEVLNIDGETPRQGMSRTGSKRQRYGGEGVAKREVGKRKRLSACFIIAEEEEEEGGAA